MAEAELVTEHDRAATVIECNDLKSETPAREAIYQRDRERSTARLAVREVRLNDLEGESGERRKKKLKGGLGVLRRG
ncbi:uncharacterized protein DS421_19g654570 [Arachis hypogaea]|uniref:Uncharacterized protein n=1 Tax=Arachis hypogaea TaxID=3818 RepID=A0A6B9VBL4_ARAHY|nr:uncharacterized protein DS421_19g654570 [Arachis hypogaea]